MKNDNSTIMDELRSFAYQEKLTWKEIAVRLHVTPNTISNWNNGHGISAAKRKAIESLIRKEKTAESVTDPLSLAMEKVWGELKEPSRARVYAYALELKNDDLSGDYLSRIRAREICYPAAEPAPDIKPLSFTTPEGQK